VKNFGRAIFCRACGKPAYTSQRLVDKVIAKRYEESGVSLRSYECPHRRYTYHLTKGDFIEPMIKPDAPWRGRETQA
jgi:hypothetical protein